MAVHTDPDSTEEITELKRVHLDGITELQASHNQAINDLSKAHRKALQTQAEHYFYLQEARDIEHFVELGARDQQLERLRQSHLWEVQNKEMVLVGRMRDNDLQNLRLLREKDALLLQEKDSKQTSIRKFQLRIKSLVLKHETFTQDLIRQHEMSMQELDCQQERSMEDLVRQQEESLHELKLEIGRLQERFDAREEQHKFALVEQAEGYKYHIQLEAAAFVHGFQSQAIQFHNALRLERQAHQGVLARDWDASQQALEVAEASHKRAIERPTNSSPTNLSRTRRRPTTNSWINTSV